MNPHFLKKAKASWLNMALATGSIFDMGTAQAYYRTREAYQTKAQQYMSQAVAGTQIRMDRFVRTFSIDLLNTRAISADREITLIRSQQVRELVIIDQAVPQKQLFFSQAQPGRDIVELNSIEGLSGLLDILAQYQHLDAVHLVSHASPGTLQLGDEQISATELKAHPEAFAVINQAIKPSGDFLFYGCELGKEEAGDDFLEIMQQHTHADLAASDDLTGNTDLEGDWELEISRGDIEATPIGNSPALRDFTEVLQWSGTVDFETGGNFTDTGNYSGGSSSDVSYTVGGVYSMTVDAYGVGIGTWAYAGTQLSTGNGVSKVAISFTSGESFDFDGIYIYSTPSDNFTLRSSNPSDIQTFSAGPAGSNVVSVSSGFTGITKLYIEVDDNSGYFSLDNIVLSNLVGTPAPITLMDFQAQRQGEAITLNWATASEQNNQGFEIQQSLDGETFEKIGFVEGAGNASEERKYEFGLLNREAAYYRFKQIDLDGQYSYSSTRFIAAWEPDQEPLIYPNPVNGEVFIDHIGDGETLVVDIFDLQGRQLSIHQGNKLEIERQLTQQFETLAKGTYVVHLRTLNQTFTQKVVTE